MDFTALGKLVIIGGLVLTAASIVMLFVPKIPLIGRLPGDILVRRDDVTFSFHVVNMLLLSLVLTLALDIVSRIFSG